MNKTTIIRKIINTFKSFIDFFLIYLPGSLGVKLRYFCYRKRFKQCGKNVVIDTENGFAIENTKFINRMINKYKG